MTDQAAELDPVAFDDASVDESRFVGFHDLYAGLSNHRLWTMMAWNDIRQRYRRSTIGPFWITISMGMFITVLGVIYAKIFNQDIATYLPYVAMGIISWGFISGTTVEATNTFIEGAGVIKQIRLPYSLFPMRMIWRSFIVFLHTVVLMIPLAIFFHLDIGLQTLLVVPGLIMVAANQIWVAIVVGIVSTRYRDVTPIVATTVQVSMFATPIMWPIGVLQGQTFIADVNPFYHLVELVRAPLLGQVAAPLSWIVVLCMCVVGYGLAGLLLKRANKRLVYWL
jgi:ABC-2 type transport system permease protein